jgi:NADPH2:quinone reductase
MRRRADINTRGRGRLRLGTLAAIDLARQLGVEVIATTRQAAHADVLAAAGAHQAIVLEGELAAVLASLGKAEAVLHLIGNSTVLDSMRATRRGGLTCLAGFLGGLDKLPAFDPLTQMPTGMHVSFFGSFNFGTAEFPVDDVPMQHIVDLCAAGELRARPARVFALQEIAHAHELMEANLAHGKFVVLV